MWRLKESTKGQYQLLVAHRTVDDSPLLPKTSNPTPSKIRMTKYGRACASSVSRKAAIWL